MSIPEIQPMTTSCADTRLAESEVSLPLVSVIVTSFNYVRYIAHCLNSVRRQTYTNWELIIVDDVSTDGTAEILDDYKSKHGTKISIKVVLRETNGGQMEAFRDGMALAKGTFVMMLDADDLLLPDFLATHMEVHLGRKAVAFTSSNQYQINEHEEIICGDHPDHLSKGEYRYLPQQVFQDTWWVWATASSMVFRRSTLNLIMPDPDVTFRICADYYIAHFCQQVGNSILIPGIHGCYRRHEENNFSANPLVGAINAMGDMSRHPPHREYRQAMIQHILRHFDRFKPIFGTMGILIMLYRIATYKEIKEILREHEDKFSTWRANLLREYVRFHKKRKHYDRSPWGKKMMLIGPPQSKFVPPPSSPGETLSTAIRKRLNRLFWGKDYDGMFNVQ